MNCTTYKEELNVTLNEVQYSSKSTEERTERLVNELLDAINNLKAILAHDSSRIEDITKKLLGITWFADLDEECIQVIKEICDLSKAWISNLKRDYAFINSSLRSKGIAKEELNRYKAAIDELTEAVEDIEAVFFEIPQNSSLAKAFGKLENMLR